MKLGYPAAAAGTTHHKNRRNGPRVKTIPGCNYRVYCPECTPNSVHVSLGGKSPKTVKFRCGHSVQVRG